MDSKLRGLNIPVSEFETRLTALNQEQFSNLSCWVFYKGMLFLGMEKWWNKGRIRPKPHEGLDVCYFRDKKSKITSINENTIIPAPYDGIVVSIKEDFIGTSVFAKLDLSSEYPLLWALGHMNLEMSIQRGTKVKEGMPLGTLAPVLKRGSGLLPHLHVSVGFFKTVDMLEIIDWHKLNDRSYIQLLDPLPLLFKNYEIIW